MTTPYNAEQRPAFSKNGFETLRAFTNTAFVGAERLGALNLSVSRTFLEDGIAHRRVLFGTKDIRELIDLQLSQAKPVAENSAKYARSVYEIASQTQQQFSALIEDGFRELNLGISAAFDAATRSAPAGLDVAVSAVKSSIAAANSVFDSASKAAHQVATLADDNIVAATNPTAFKSPRVVSAVVPAAKARKAA